MLSSAARCGGSRRRTALRPSSDHPDMKTIKTTALSLAGAALIAGPAFADRPPNPGSNGNHGGQGQKTAPGQLCKKESRKKTNHGKGKSPFAACVVGAKSAQAETAAQKEQGSTTTPHTAPAKLCKDMSHKKSATDKKSPFAACVSGAAK